MNIVRSITFLKFKIIFLAFTYFSPLSANQFEDAASLNSFGMPGEIDLPLATNLPDGQFSVSSSYFGGTIRINLSFQILESLTGAFRYARVPSSVGDHRGYFWDRSFDLHYLLKKEKDIFPSIAIGLRDFIGTGLYSGEYFVVTKSLGPKLKVSGGIGWGSLSGKNTFNNIFGRGNNRANMGTDLGGTFHIRQFFSGSNSPFFSINYTLSEKVQLITEFSSHDYNHETSTPKGFTRKSDFNFGIKYKVDSTVNVIGSFMHGDTLGLALNFGVNPKNSPHKTGIEPAPMPLLEKKYIKPIDTSENSIFLESKRLLNLEGIDLKKIELSENLLKADIVNRRYFNVSQLVGRVIRILSRTSPENIKKFQINILDHRSSLFVSKIAVDRSNFIANELDFDGPERLWETVSVENSKKQVGNDLHQQVRNLSWSFYPYLDGMLFDPHAPIRWTIGGELLVRYKLSSTGSFSSSIRQPLGGTMDDIKRGPKGGLPNVRSDFMFYHRDIGTNLFINYLTYDQYFKPRSDIYGLVNFGYLELMHAGLRSEIIWKNNKKPYALGLDFAKVQKRQTRGDFSLKDEHYTTFLASVYYDLPNDWIIKFDAGRYLAGDLGSTISIERTFNNGWQLGAYATLTDVPFTTWGEGSFDKGLLIKAPLTWFTGKKSKSTLSAVIRPITGDGGGKLRLARENYLYKTISEYDYKSLNDNWKRVYR